MIRTATSDDMPALLTLAEGTGMFHGDELAALGEMVSAYFDGHLGPEHVWVVDDVSEGGGDGSLAGDGTPIRGAAYYAAETMAQGVWNLYFIGVDARHRRQGLAQALLAHVEQALCARGVRLLMIETSSLDQYEPARRMYRKHGYDEEARIREFYQAGEDKIVFRKKLAAQPGKSM